MPKQTILEVLIDTGRAKELYQTKGSIIALEKSLETKKTKPIKIKKPRAKDNPKYKVAMNYRRRFRNFQFQKTRRILMIYLFLVCNYNY